MEQRDPLPPGHPEEHQWESACIRQRSTTINEAEAGLCLTITALMADGHEVSAAEASRALRGIRGVEEAAFIVKAFYPEHFLIECHLGKTRDRILGASPLPIARTFLVLRPWSRLAHADASSMKFKVSLKLEGIPPHAWAEDTAAKILAPSCRLHVVDQHSASLMDLSTYKLTAWTCDP